ncbi:MAG: tetratricopeptide repeat protein, partial [Salinivirgaceae bacterium]
MNRFIVLSFILAISQIAFSQTIDELQSGYSEAKTNGDTNQEIFYLNKIAYHHWENGNNEMAAEEFEKLLSLTQKQGNEAGLRNTYTNLGLVYSDLSQYEKAINAFNQSLTISKKQKNKPAIASGYVNIAMAYQSAERYKEALSAAENALELAQELDQLELVRSCYGMLAEIHKALGNSEETMEYFNRYSTFDKHLKEQEFKQIKQESEEVVLKAQFQKQKTEQELSQERGRLRATEDTLMHVSQILAKQKHINRLQEEKEKVLQERLRNEAIIRYLLLGIAVIIFVFAFFIFRQVRKTKKVNTALAKKNEEIKAQSDEIRIQAEKIRASIQYAQRIQTAVLPPEPLFEKYLNEYFVLFKPRDIVSGDFYWMTEKNEKLIIAAADCTGHGVPGAFMSMLGVAFLNEIVNKLIENKHVKSLQASEVLMHLKDYVIRSLHQEGNVHEAKDGMDIGLLVIDKQTGELQFAGAHNPMILIRDGEMQIFKGDPMAISYNRDVDAEFTNHEIQTKPSDIIYIYSDGYQDQFGGKNGRKFMVKRFKRLLLEIHKESLDKQKHILDRTIMEWKKNDKQVDDMLVMGLKMNFKDIDKSQQRSFNWSEKTILIAEDTEANYLYLVEALRKTEVKLVRARNGQEAVDIALERNDIDLVLMDLNMP